MALSGPTYISGGAGIPLHCDSHGRCFCECVVFLARPYGLRRGYCPMMGKQKTYHNEKKSRLAPPQNIRGHVQQHSKGWCNGSRASSPCYVCQSSGRTSVWLIYSRERTTRSISRPTQRSTTHRRSSFEIIIAVVVAVVGVVQLGLPLFCSHSLAASNAWARNRLQ